MGSTCFMNVILQCFIHNPLLRGYFLSDQHSSKRCEVKTECMGCEMDQLFTQVRIVQVNGKSIERHTEGFLTDVSIF